MFEQYNETEQSPSDDSELRRRLASGAHWFYWIAGLSLVNSIVSLFDGNWNFAVGLGVTQIFDALGKIEVQEGSGDWLKYVFFVINVFAAATFALFGIFASRGQIWAFITGMILFALDGLILVFVGDILGVIIHALAIYFLFRGLSATRQLHLIEKNLTTQQ